jgi:chromate reductase
MNGIRILGIVGSQRKDSCNRLALRAAQQLVPADAVIELIELDGIPFFEAQRECLPPPAVIEFRRRIAQADAVLFATPECNHAVPGGLKSAIDWSARPRGQNVWRGKPAAVISACDGRLINARAQAHLRQALHRLQSPTVSQPWTGGGNGERHFDRLGNLNDAASRRFIEQLLAALVGLVRANWAIRGFTDRESA